MIIIIKIKKYLRYLTDQIERDRPLKSINFGIYDLNINRQP